MYACITNKAIDNSVICWLYVFSANGSPIEAEWLQLERRYRKEVSLALEKALLGPYGYPATFSLEDSMEPILKHYDDHLDEYLEEARSFWRKAAAILQQVVDASDSVIKSLLTDDRKSIQEWCEQLQVTQGTDDIKWIHTPTHTYSHEDKKTFWTNYDRSITHAILKPGIRRSQLELFKSQSVHPLFDKRRVFLRDWGARLTDQWFSFLPKDVQDDIEKLIYGDKTVLDKSHFISLKEDIHAWLIKLFHLLTLYSKAEEDIAVGSNSNTGQVNWLSDFPATELKWLGTRVNISKWIKIYLEL
jgi:hypothetical protein